ncbi:MAG: 2-dehydropantoate 2-reductase [Colwellia sp.]
MPSISIIGPGAIGGTLAGWLAQHSANHVSLCARTTFERLVLDTPFGTIDTSPTIYTNPEETQPVDWVIVATKTYQVESAIPWLKKLCHQGTRVAVVQNGVEHLSCLAGSFPQERTVPVVIDCPAMRSAPGRIKQLGPIDFALPDDQNARDFAALFDHTTIAVRHLDNWKTAAWNKLCTNASGAVCALTNQQANIAKNPVAARIMEDLIREVIAVGRAEGAEIEDAMIETVIASQSSAPDGVTNSIHGDLIAKKPMEWSARNDVVARLGEKHGIATPYNKMAADILQVVEKNYKSEMKVIPK